MQYPYKNRANLWAGKLRSLLLALSIAALAACGGGGGGGSSGGNSSSSSSSSSGGPASINFASAEVIAGGDADSPKMLKLTWAVDSEPHHYRIEANPDGDSGFADAELGDIAGDQTEYQFEVPLHLLKWETARLQLVALDEGGEELGRSEEIPLDQVEIGEMVGYFKSPTVGKLFSARMAVSGDGRTLAVAGRNPDGELLVHVFSYADGSWGQAVQVEPDEWDDEDFFGGSLALSRDGSVLAVGAPSEDSNANTVDGDAANNDATDSGAAYIFARAAGAWTQQAYLKASNADPYDSFGYSIALSADGDRLAVGATGEDSADGDPADNSGNFPGAVYAFSDTGSGWQEQAYLKASDIGESNWFGNDLALSANGKILAVGVYNAYESAEPGRVFIFTEETGSWSQAGDPLVRNSSGDDDFGYYLGLSGDGQTLMASMNVHNPGNISSAYVYRGGPGNWDAGTRLLPALVEDDDGFGISVDISVNGEVIAVGSALEDGADTGINGDETDNNSLDSGAVYVFDNPDDLTQYRYIKAPNNGQEDYFGFGVALSGDGKRLFVGAPQEDSTATEIGGNRDSNGGEDVGALYAY